MLSRPVERKTADVELATPEYSEDASFPFQVSIPLALCMWLGLPRSYPVKNSKQEIPVPLIEWMRDDTRYTRMFAKEVEADFTTLDGIGAAGDAKLKAANIKTVKDLAGTSAETVAGLLGKTVTVEKAQQILDSLEV